jgi:hypothetical protein
VNLLKALLSELRLRPMATSMTLAAIFVGVAALILGEGASKAFTIIGGPHGGALIAHLMGALLAAGGVVTVAGVARLGSLAELFGLGLISAGAFIYGAGVLLGLGHQGLIAGGLALGLSVGAGLRVWLLSAAARQLADDRR